MFSLGNEHVGSDERQGRGGGRPDRSEGFLHRAEDANHATERPVAAVHHVRTSGRAEGGSDQDVPVVGDVLDHAQLPSTPSHLDRGDADRGIRLYRNSQV
jgi:hypothetical protein